MAGTAAFCAIFVLMGCSKPPEPAPAPTAAKEAPPRQATEALPPDPGAPPGPAASSGPPNVVLLIIDTLRADKMGCYGFDRDTCPEIDALARQGVRFSEVVSQCSWTRPSIGSILTSRYPRSLGMYVERDQALGEGFFTFAELLHNAGYRTIGMTANPHLNSSFNFHQGFDVYVDSNVVYTFMKEKDEQQLFTKSKVKSSPEMFDHVLKLAAAGEGEGQPKYVQLLLMEVHEWCRPKHSLIRKEFDGRFKDLRYSAYYDALRQLSQDVGAFVNDLTALPGWENTLFIITGDHGEGLEDHPHVEKSKYHGRLLYESQLMVPWIMYQSNHAFDVSEVSQQVRLLDIVPTVLDYLGIAVPESLDGSSVLPLLKDASAHVDLPEYFVAETKLRGHDKISAYSAEWKYIESRDKQKGLNPRELQAFGTVEDGALTDQLEGHEAVAGQMETYLREWEKKYPEAKPIPCKAALSDEEAGQLKAIGYLE